MRFAILEDDPAQMEVLTGWLREAGHDVHGFGLARELMRVASRESFDLFLVDWVLPDLTGEQVLRWLRVERGNDTPAIFITSRDAEEDIANAFSAGADDYLIKPFGIGELLARVRVALRRRGQVTDSPSPLVQLGDVCIDLVSRRITRGDEEIHLTPIEFRLLGELLAHSDKVLTHRQLLLAVWGPTFVEHNHYLRIYMGHLRQKLEQDPTLPRYLLTETGVGYRYHAE